MERNAGRPGLKRVLVVDDDRDQLDALKDLLELSGGEVEVAATVHEAIESVRSARFDLILCDMLMPSMSGWQLVEEMRALAPQSIIYLLTGWSPELTENDPRRTLVTGILQKPVDLEQVRAVLAGGSTPPPVD